MCVYVCVCVVYILLGTAMGCHELTFRLPALSLEGCVYYIFHLFICVYYIYICVYVYIYI